MIEADRVAAWAYGLLRADTATGGVNALTSGRIYRDLVPQQAALPAVVVALIATTDDVAIGGRRVVTTVTFSVRVVGEGAAYTTIRPIADRVDTILHGTSGTSGTVKITKALRSGTEQYLETSDGVAYADIVLLYTTQAYTA